MSQPLFPAGRAFIVHFSRDAHPGDQVQVCGRVEHVASGRSSRFATAEDLFAFVDEVIHERRGVSLAEEVGS